MLGSIGDWSATTGEYIVSGLAVAIGGYLAKHRHDAKQERGQIVTEIRGLTSALLGEPATPLNPHPAAGLMKRVDTQTAIVEGLVGEMAENTVALNAMALRQNQANGTMKRVEEMVKDIRGIPVSVTLPEIASAIDASTESSSARADEVLDAIKGKE